MSQLGTALTVPQLRLVHNELTSGNWIDAANLIAVGLGEQPVFTQRADAERLVRMLYEAMTDAGNYCGAATLCLPTVMYNAEPISVQRQAKAWHEHALLLSCGCSSASKTYSLVVFAYLDWLRDPAFTAVRLMSQTEGHLETNVWSHLLEIHERNVLKPLREVSVKPTDLWMGLKDSPMSYGFRGIAFKQSQRTSSAFFGMKPQPKRPANDPNHGVFGSMTNLRVVIDEAQHVPQGVWQGLNSITASISGRRVKVAAAFNPENLGQPVVQLAEPPGGWHPDQMETLYDWESRHGWWVCRIDAAKTENVMQRKEVYPGLMTYERYLGYLKGGGDNSPAFSTFARGFPPLAEAANTVIPPEWVSSQKGEAIYQGRVEHVFACDLAYQGQDRAVLGIGRWGLASGWRDADGKMHVFENRLSPGQKQPRHVLTIDQMFPLAKAADNVSVTQEIMGRAKLLGLTPEWGAVDCTGNGAATHGYMVKFWGNVLGVNWAHASSDTKVLNEDIGTCNDRFEGISSEMWFSLKHWMDPVVNAVLFNPQIFVGTTDFYSQLTSRRFHHTRAGRLKVENKEEYRGRNGGRSPDEADVAVMMLHLVRMRGGVIPGMIEQHDRRRKSDGTEPYRSFSPVVNGRLEQDEEMEPMGADARGDMQLGDGGE